MFLKTSLDDYFDQKSLFFLNWCHKNVEKSGGQTMGQKTGKYDVFCVTATTLTKTCGGGAGCFIL